MANQLENVSNDSGSWVTAKISYVEPLRLSCALCGRPIAKRYWRALVRGQDMIFCEPGHTKLYETYWIPTHGHEPS